METLDHEDGQSHTHFEQHTPVPAVELDYGEIDSDLGFTEPDVLDESDPDNVSAWEFLLSEPKARTFLTRIRRAVVRIAEARNSKMAATAFLIATGDDSIADTSISKTAKLHGLSKASVSLVCVRWCEFLGKKPSAYMRSEAAKETFRLTNQRNTIIEKPKK